MSVIVEFSIFPLGAGESVSGEVAKAVDLIRKSGLPYKFGPMSTSIEGEWSEVMDVVTRCHDLLREDNNRVLLYIRADSRDGGNRMQQKMSAVKNAIGEDV